MQLKISKALFVSIACHLLLLLVLAEMPIQLPNSPVSKDQPQPIAAYIYHSPVKSKPISAAYDSKPISAPLPVTKVKPSAVIAKSVRVKAVPEKVVQQSATHPKQRKATESQGQGETKPHSSSLAQRSLSRLNQRLNHDFLQQYRKEVQSPLAFAVQHGVPSLTTPTQHTTRQVTLDCTKTGVSSLALLSQLMGGDMECLKLQGVKEQLSLPTH